LRIFFSVLLLTLFSRRFGGNVWIHALRLVADPLDAQPAFARLVLCPDAAAGSGHFQPAPAAVGLRLALAVAGAVWVWAKRTLPALGPADTANLNATLDYAQRVLTAGPALYLLYPFRLVVRPFFAPDAAAFFAALAPALLIFLLHYLWVIYSDVAFEEASLEASQKLAARVAAVRAGNWRGVKKNQKARRPWFKLSATGPAATALFWKNLIGVGQVFSVRLWIIIAVVMVIFGFVLAGQAQNHGISMVAAFSLPLPWAIRCCWGRNCCGWIFGMTCRWRTS
jgi:hypothetical protein